LNASPERHREANYRLAAELFTDLLSNLSFRAHNAACLSVVANHPALPHLRWQPGSPKVENGAKCHRPGNVGIAFSGIRLQVCAQR
jgi:hypothetical protein